ncbi:MAG: hypothetical protein ACXABY_35970 [Candidatus Thorarchaeota archaeon]|jgi:predicted GNAT family acetyltransferase
MAKKTRNAKRKLPGHRHVFIKLFQNSAEVSVAMTKDLAKVYGGLYNFTDHSSSMSKWNILAIGRVYWASGQNTYYGTYTKVQDSFLGQGHGDYLYKALILAAKELAKQDERDKVLFSPHAAVGSSTSDSAWRCYAALARKGYLKPTSGTIEKTSVYEVVKTPKCIKPTVLKVWAA